MGLIRIQNLRYVRDPKMPAEPKGESRCLHFKQVKIGSRWKCTNCGKMLTIDQSIQNSVELANVMRSAMENGRTLDESIDELLGLREWEEIRSRIPDAGKKKTRLLRKREVLKRGL